MTSIQSATSSGVQAKQAGRELQPVTFSHLPPPKYWQPVSVRTSDRLLSKPGRTAGVSTVSSLVVASAGPKYCSAVSLDSSDGTFSQKCLTLSVDVISKNSYDVSCYFIRFSDLYLRIFVVLMHFILLHLLFYMRAWSFYNHASTDASLVAKGRAMDWRTCSYNMQ